MTRVRKVLPGPQRFLHYQEALEEREVCMFLPPTCALLGGTSGRRDTCNSPSTLFLTFCMTVSRVWQSFLVTDFFTKNYQYYICPLGKLKTNTI